MFISSVFQATVESHPKPSDLCIQRRPEFNCNLGRWWKMSREDIQELLFQLVCRFPTSVTACVRYQLMVSHSHCGFCSISQFLSQFLQNCLNKTEVLLSDFVRRCSRNINCWILSLRTIPSTRLRILASKQFIVLKQFGELENSLRFDLQSHKKI